MKRFFPFMLLSALVVMCSCGEPAAQDANGVSQRITLEQLDTLDMTNMYVLDVRTPEEFAGGALPNAVNIDWNGDDFAAAVQSKVDKDKPVLIYCAAGGRSAKATSKLVALGYTELYDLGPGYSGYAERQRRGGGGH